MNEKAQGTGGSAQPLDAELVRKRIKAARWALVVVGVVSLGVVIFETFQVKRELDKYGLGLGDIETPYLILFAVAYIWAFGYLALSFVAKTRPFGAALTGLIMYGVDLVGGAILDPSTLYKGILLKALIIGVLIKAVIAGRDHKRAMLAEAAENAFS